MTNLSNPIVLIVFSLLIGCCHAHAGGVKGKKSVPSEGGSRLKKIVSRFGAVESSSAGDLFSLKLDGKIIFQDDAYIQDSHAIVSDGQLKRKDFLILSRYSGDSCPEETVLILINESSREVYRFGNCNSPEIRVETDAISFTYSTLKEAGRKPQKWIYKDDKLLRLK